tara:strand:- start:968 stop:1363 length:396 start_codon:yes stop_codon:yes gene_type:complete
MPKNQLFKIIPDENIIQDILEAFGLTNLEDTRLFTKSHMIEINTVNTINELKEKLIEYYLPCKARKYLNDLDEKKCITILRQIVKLYHYKCIGLEKSIKGNKTMTYRLLYSKEDFLESPHSSNTGYVLSFE